MTRMFGGPAGYGHKGYVQSGLPSGGWFLALPGPRRTPWLHFAQRLGLSPSPQPIDLRGSVQSVQGPGIFDQAATSSCTGHAEVGAVMTRLVLMGTPAPEKLSPIDAYFKGRRVDLPLLPSGSPQPLTDDGAVPEQVTRGCQEWGICPWRLRPTDPATVNAEITAEQIAAGMRARVSGIYSLQASADPEADVRQALSAGFPVKLGSLIDPTFESWAGGDPCPAPNAAQVLGGHAIYLCGWAQWAGGFEYYAANSWGSGVGEGGFWRVSSQWLLQASDLEVADIQPLEAA